MYHAGDRTAVPASATLPRLSGRLQLEQAPAPACGKPAAVRAERGCRVVSAAARKWLSRLSIGGASQKLVLGVLADAADKGGRVNLSQAAIAQRAGVSEITTRRALSSLQEAGLVRREHRSAGGKTGRIADLIYLNMEDSGVVQPVKMIGNDVGATDQNDRLQTVVQPVKMIVAPTNSPEPKSATKSTLRARADVYTTSPDTIRARTSGRVWLEKRRGTWRARVRLDGAELDLGRFPTEAEAASALERALADIEHASALRSGEPRQPRQNPDSFDIAELGAELPDTWSQPWRDAYRMLAGERLTTRSGQAYDVIEHELRDGWMRVQMVDTGETFIAEAPPGDDLVRLPAPRRRVNAPSIEPDDAAIEFGEMHVKRRGEAR